jgi:hypothetical protein
MVKSYKNRNVYLSDMQNAISKSPLYEVGMEVKDIGSGIEIVKYGKKIDSAVSNLVIADAHNYLSNVNS